MKGKMPVKERIRKGFLYLDQKTPSVSEEERKKMQAMLYLLAVKFLTKEELNEIKEEIGMTILGQMLMDDGIQKGAQEARAAAIMDILEELGTITSDLAVRIRSEKNEGTLKRWVKLAAKAESVEQFTAEM